MDTSFSANAGSRFGSYNFSRNGFSRNQNTVRNSSGLPKIGTVSFAVIFAVQALLFGLVYVSESTKATSLDYEISGLSAEIEDLEAKKEDLAVERARLSSIAASNSSQVAAAMETAEAAGYAE